MKKTRLTLLLLSVLSIFNYTFTFGQKAPESASISTGNIELSFNADTRTFEIKDNYLGLLLSAGVVKTVVDGKPISSNDPSLTRNVIDNSNGTLTIQFHEKLTVKAVLSNDSMLTFSTEGSREELVFFNAKAALSDKAMGAFLKNEKANDQKVLVQTLGIGDVAGLISIFDPMKDLAIQAASDGKANWNFDYQWELNASAKSGEALCKLKLKRNYYRETLGVEYYGPIKKRSYFEKAPALAMTWVGIEGKINRPDFSQRKEWLYPNIDWVSRHLLPYAGEMVFQLDDNYPIDDPQYMRDISDYIRSKNMIPGIWIAPFGVAPYDESKEHPDWFLQKEDSTTMVTFSGLSYDDFKHYSSAILNVNNKDAVDKWFAGFFREISETWNYDYFKIDGMPLIFDNYIKSANGGGIEGARNGLRIIRSVVGDDKYINSCWGLPIEGLGIVNGSRVGDDTEQEHQVISSVSVAYNYLNNVAWYSDPDGAANMYASTTARARLNFQGRSILGQPYVTDDNWTKVSEEILNVWQKTLPTIESFPTNLYPIDDYDKYDLFDLKIKKTWGEWDVVSLNNYEEKARTMVLDLARLPLNSQKVYVYDFWNQKYLGTFNSDDKITRNLNAIDADCFSVVPVKNDRPVLLSTSRHITQGGIDLEKMSTIKENDGWLIIGESSHLVEGDVYELTFKTNGFSLGDFKVKNGTASVDTKTGITRIKIIPIQSTENWELHFVKSDQLFVSLGAELTHIIPGKPISIPILVANGSSANWKVKSTSKEIIIKEDHTNSSISIDVAPSVLELDKTWSGSTTLESTDAQVLTQSFNVDVLGPVRDNIARDATADASTIYFWGDQNGYGRPSYVNDGIEFKAWEAAEGETSGWIELKWKKPVTFQRIVIDEWTESGGSIASWTLEAGHKKYEYTPKKETKSIVTYDPEKESMEEISKGDSIGKGFIIELDKPVTANTLRLTINKSSQRPGVWELQVNPYLETTEK